jgi:hypothetical protein
MKARQKGKQNAKRELEIRLIAEARAAIKAWGFRKYTMSILP